GGGAHWVRPAGGMFFWVTLPAALDSAALLPRAVEAGVAYVPGAAFYPVGGASGPAPAHTLRLSFVTVAPAQIEAAITTLARVFREALEQ
ncbi:MAG: PLP-dependent aminotransferase family protein, partial [Rubrivivax sp.]